LKKKKVKKEVTVLLEELTKIGSTFYYEEKNNSDYHVR